MFCLLETFTDNGRKYKISTHLSDYHDNSLKALLDMPTMPRFCLQSLQGLVQREGIEADFVKARYLNCILSHTFIVSKTKIISRLY